MSNSLQSFFARSIPKTQDDLIAALNRIPEDKRSWSPMGEARTALDQIAECALLNGNTADMLTSKAGMPADFDMAAYFQTKTALAQDGDKAVELLKTNTAKAVAAIEALSDEDLDISVDMPWGPMTLAQIASYPYWNMCYHEGQINYIASMLGTLS